MEKPPVTGAFAIRDGEASAFRQATEGVCFDAFSDERVGWVAFRLHPLIDFLLGISQLFAEFGGVDFHDALHVVKERVETLCACGIVAFQLVLAFVQLRGVGFEGLDGGTGGFRAEDTLRLFGGFRVRVARLVGRFYGHGYAFQNGGREVVLIGYMYTNG